MSGPGGDITLQDGERGWSSFAVKKEHAESRMSNRGRNGLFSSLQSVPINYYGCKDRKKEILRFYLFIIIFLANN